MQRFAWDLGRLWLCACACLLGVRAQVYVRTEAQPGDGTIALLRRFGVYADCNVDKFCALNSLKPTTPLRMGQAYDLPILRYTYNGTSIRTTLGIQDRPRAERIQAYNEAAQQRGLRDTDFRDSKDLWVPYHFIACPSQTPAWPPAKPEAPPPKPPTAPPTKPAGTAQAASTAKLVEGKFPLFGAGYQEIPWRSSKLRNCVYYVVSGHGGPDPGAIATYNGKQLYEDEYAYDVALRLARALISHGATVYVIIRDPDDGIRDAEILTPDKDEVCYGNKPLYHHQKSRLTQQSQAINTLFLRHRKNGTKVQRVINIHVDADEDGGRQDLAFFFRYRSAGSEALARTLRDVVREQYAAQQKGRNYQGFVQARSLHMVREVMPPAVLVELGNINNRRDQQRIAKASNRQLIAEWLCAGLLRDAAP